MISHNLNARSDELGRFATVSRMPGISIGVGFIPLASLRANLSKNAMPVPTKLVVTAGTNQMEHNATETELSKLVLHMILDFQVSFLSLCSFWQNACHKRKVPQLR